MFAPGYYSRSWYAHWYYSPGADQSVSGPYRVESAGALAGLIIDAAQTTGFAPVAASVLVGPAIDNAEVQPA